MSSGMDVLSSYLGLASKAGRSPGPFSEGCSPQSAAGEQGNKVVWQSLAHQAGRHGGRGGAWWKVLVTIAFVCLIAAYLTKPSVPQAFGVAAPSPTVEDGLLDSPSATSSFSSFNGPANSSNQHRSKTNSSSKWKQRAPPQPPPPPLDHDPGPLDHHLAHRYRGTTTIVRDWGLFKTAYIRAPPEWSYENPVVGAGAGTGKSIDKSPALGAHHQQQQGKLGKGQQGGSVSRRKKAGAATAAAAAVGRDSAEGTSDEGRRSRRQGGGASSSSRQQQQSSSKQAPGQEKDLLLGFWVGLFGKWFGWVMDDPSNPSTGPGGMSLQIGQVTTLVLGPVPPPSSSSSATPASSHPPTPTQQQGGGEHQKHQKKEQGLPVSVKEEVEADGAGEKDELLGEAGLEQETEADGESTEDLKGNLDGTSAAPSAGARPSRPSKRVVYRPGQRRTSPISLAKLRSVVARENAINSGESSSDLEPGAGLNGGIAAEQEEAAELGAVAKKALGLNPSPEAAPMSPVEHPAKMDLPKIRIPPPALDASTLASPGAAAADNAALKARNGSKSPEIGTTPPLPSSNNKKGGGGKRVPTPTSASTPAAAETSQAPPQQQPQQSKKASKPPKTVTSPIEPSPPSPPRPNKAASPQPSPAKEAPPKVVPSKEDVAAKALAAEREKEARLERDREAAERKEEKKRKEKERKERKAREEAEALAAVGAAAAAGNGKAPATAPAKKDEAAKASKDQSNSDGAVGKIMRKVPGLGMRMVPNLSSKNAPEPKKPAPAPTAAADKLSVQTGGPRPNGQGPHSAGAVPPPPPPQQNKGGFFARRPPNAAGNNQQVPFYARQGWPRFGGGQFGNNANNPQQAGSPPVQGASSPTADSPSDPALGYQEYGQQGYSASGQQYPYVGYDMYQPNSNSLAPTTQGHVSGFLEHRNQHQQAHVNELQNAGVFPGSGGQQHQDGGLTFKPFDFDDDLSPYPSSGDPFPRNPDFRTRSTEDFQMYKTGATGSRPHLSLPLQYLESGLLATNDPSSPTEDSTLSPMTPHQASLIPSQLFHMLDEDEDDELAMHYGLIDSPTTSRTAAANQQSLAGWQGLAVEMGPRSSTPVLPSVDERVRSSSRSPVSDGEDQLPALQMPSSTSGGAWPEHHLLSRKATSSPRDDLPRQTLQLNPGAKAFDYRARSRSSSNAAAGTQHLLPTSTSGGSGTTAFGDASGQRSPTHTTFAASAFDDIGVLPAKSRFDFEHRSNGSAGSSSSFPVGFTGALMDARRRNSGSPIAGPPTASAGSSGSTSKRESGDWQGRTSSPPSILGVSAAVSSASAVAGGSKSAPPAISAFDPFADEDSLLGPLKPGQM